MRTRNWDWTQAYKSWRRLKIGIVFRVIFKLYAYLQTPERCELYQTIFVNAFPILCKQHYVGTRPVGCMHRSIDLRFGRNPSKYVCTVCKPKVMRGVEQGEGAPIPQQLQSSCEVFMVTPACKLL